MWYRAEITLTDDSVIVEVREANSSIELITAIKSERVGTLKRIKAWLCAAPEE